jgi:hypothetical protein
MSMWDMMDMGHGAWGIGDYALLASLATEHLVLGPS